MTRIRIRFKTSEVTLPMSEIVVLTLNHVSDAIEVSDLYLHLYIICCPNKKLMLINGASH